MRRVVLGLALLAQAAGAGSLHAHGTAVDGAAGDWFGAPTSIPNLGRIARNVARQGEYVWKDAAGDAHPGRPDAASRDLVESRVSGYPERLFGSGGGLELLDSGLDPVVADLQVARGGGGEIEQSNAATELLSLSRFRPGDAGVPDSGEGMGVFPGGGAWELEWDGRDDSGRLVPPGADAVRGATPGGTRSRRAVRLR